jgi:hypothetical protein
MDNVLEDVDFILILSSHFIHKKWYFLDIQPLNMDEI